MGERENKSISQSQALLPSKVTNIISYHDKNIIQVEDEDTKQNEEKNNIHKEVQNNDSCESNNKTKHEPASVIACSSRIIKREK